MWTVLAQMTPGERWWALNKGWVLLVAILVPTVALIVVCVYLQARKTQKILESVLPRFAGRFRKGLNLAADVVVDGLPAEAEWPNGGADSTHVFRCALPSQGRLKLRAGGLEAVIEKVAGLPFKIRTGDLIFDKDVLVTSDDELWAKSVLHAGARLAFTQLQMRFYRLTAELRDGRLTVTGHSLSEGLVADEVGAFLEGCGRLASKVRAGP